MGLRDSVSGSTPGRQWWVTLGAQRCTISWRLATQPTSPPDCSRSRRQAPWFSAEDYDLVCDRVAVRSLGTPNLKGKSLPTEVFELIGFQNEP